MSDENILTIVLTIVFTTVYIPLRKIFKKINHFEIGKEGIKIKFKSSENDKDKK